MTSINEAKIEQNMNHLIQNYGIQLLNYMSDCEREEKALLSAFDKVDDQIIKASLELLKQNNLISVRTEEIMPPNIYYHLTKDGELILQMIYKFESLNFE
ncbi:winged helix-turn-helix transcriptional regulator [Mammaliicoccus sciuri]|uniref:winged helix-turn-helix transcriptional regulator n=1 Tax=Mammaliicoccus sciuri TaxID=1296 RepID=UPI0021D2B073|nr:winged helix-turn-helix transcriptional regulator [Mammaliicoccus sciuri]UXU83571.1 winged helix-turn-helix transcriptional regulator [Mammaliicoccus sciuri]UXU93418.1 winged helix-turn-helix transcriptional regulator [Mammaliicoccus sciuri]UXV15366.1 winged helix-turn-helix transcriptional regulator [Mammaliicoccus sciuri]UXV23631.1 winged helix-turn-helix transcriptional regulator [Mammaliicoccus sciuri]UXV26409.1 winged helix-turn-helix transcriptional regulator [Mammaliicoccus sciuri]